MMESDRFPTLAALVARLAGASWKERDGIREELLATAAADGDREGVREFLDAARKEVDLETRWELDEVIERLAPPPPPPAEPEPEPEPEPQANRPLSAADLVLVYDDPRGLQLYRHRHDDRWFATQPHPMTGQPQLLQLYPQEIATLKAQLAKSPYWVLGSGGAAGA